MKTILDPSFRYTASFSTDIRKTFAKIRRHQRQQLQQTRQAPAAAANVAPLIRRVVTLR